MQIYIETKRRNNVNDTLYDKVVHALKQAEQHNSNIMVKPEVILWPDPERQWLSVIPVLQKEFHALIIFGVYDAEKKQGPAIWVKCMVEDASRSQLAC